MTFSTEELEFHVCLANVEDVPGAFEYMRTNECRNLLLIHAAELSILPLFKLLCFEVLIKLFVCIAFRNWRFEVVSFRGRHFDRAAMQSSRCVGVIPGDLPVFQSANSRSVLFRLSSNGTPVSLRIVLISSSALAASASFERGHQ